MKPFNFEGLKCNDSKLSDKVLEMLQNLDSCVGEYGSDVHNKLFNESEGYIFYAEAEEALNEVGTWDCIKQVLQYENNNFGVVDLKNLNSCHIANMMIYIIGIEVLAESDHLQNSVWDKELTPDDLEIICNELQDYLVSVDMDLTELAFI